MERFFLVYKTINKIKGEYYIGVHVTDDIDDDYLGSGKRLRFSVEKYGRESFEKQIIAIFDNPIDMFNMEAELVNEVTLKDPLCLNLKTGGYGGWNLKDKSLIYSSEHQKRRSKMGDPIWRAENAEKISEWSKKGLILAQEKLAIMRKSGYVSKGSTGKHHSEEFKQRMSKIMSEAMAGEKNSQYGTCWIHSLIEKRSKKIKKEELSSWLELGWIVGRKIKFD